MKILPCIFKSHYLPIPNYLQCDLLNSLDLFRTTLFEKEQTIKSKQYNQVIYFLYNRFKTLTYIYNKIQKV